MGFVAKHRLKARNGTNLLNIAIKKHHAMALARKWVLKIKSEKRAVHVQGAPRQVKEIRPFWERLKNRSTRKPRRIFSRGFPTPSLPFCTILNIENLELKSLGRVFSKVHTNNDFVD